MAIVLSVAAGVLAALSPCVLPVLPLVIGSAARGHRAGPLALAAGLVSMFAVVGVALATVGASAPISEDTVRLGSAVLLALSGLALRSVTLHDRVSAVFTPLAGLMTRWSSRAGDGLDGQFAVGALLGGVWNPCVGPTLGAALGLAGRADSVTGASLMLVGFGVGSAIPLVGMAYASQRMMRRRAVLLRTVRLGQSLLGATLLLTALLVGSGLDKALEAVVVVHLPSWWVDVLASF